MNVQSVPSFSSIQLSPSSYQPDCLSEFAKLAPLVSFTPLLCQLNNFDSWMLTPEHHSTCMNYLSTSDSKKDFVKFVQNRVMAGDIEAAIVALELGKRDCWPEIYRLQRDT